MNAKKEADYQYNRALKMAQQAFPTATHFEEVTRKATEVEVQIQLQFAQVTAIREQTEVLRRIATALERQDVVERKWLERQEAEVLLVKGWVLVDDNQYGDDKNMFVGRPRNVPKDAEGGGDGG